jgi:type II secretory pathway component PulJ
MERQIAMQRATTFIRHLLRRLGVREVPSTNAVEKEVIFTSRIPSEYWIMEQVWQAAISWDL